MKGWGAMMGWMAWGLLLCACSGSTTSTETAAGGSSGASAAAGSAGTTMAGAGALPAQAAISLQIGGPSSTCPVPGMVYPVGTRAPSDIDPGQSVIDGESGTAISCSVRGTGPYTFSGSLHATSSDKNEDPITVTFSGGTVNADKTTGNSVSVSVFTPQLDGTFASASTPCTVTVIDQQKAGESRQHLGGFHRAPASPRRHRANACPAIRAEREHASARKLRRLLTAQGSSNAAVFVVSTNPERTALAAAFNRPRQSFRAQFAPSCGRTRIAQSEQRNDCMGNLKGKRAFVTGASQGIGAAIAEGLIDAGADVCLHYFQSDATPRALAEKAKALGQRALVLQADLRQRIRKRRGSSNRRRSFSAASTS